MLAVVQRVASAEVTVDDPPHRAAIGRGLCVLVCVEPEDDAARAAALAGRLARLRIFPDAQGRMNLPVTAVDGDVLAISQFTLAGDCSGGNRPSFIGAARPEFARPIFEGLCTALDALLPRPAGRGVFAAAMRVALVNDGPVTLILREGRSAAPGG